MYTKWLYVWDAWLTFSPQSLSSSQGEEEKSWQIRSGITRLRFTIDMSHGCKMRMQDLFYCQPYWVQLQMEIPIQTPCSPWDLTTGQTSVMSSWMSCLAKWYCWQLPVTITTTWKLSDSCLVRDIHCVRQVSLKTGAKPFLPRMTIHYSVFRYYNLGQNKWNIWTTPPPISMMPKWRASCSFAPSSLLWGGWGIIVPFYTVQDCSSPIGDSGSRGLGSNIIATLLI